MADYFEATPANDTTAAATGANTNGEAMEEIMVCNSTEIYHSIKLTF
jgi:hypothetical protein